MATPAPVPLTARQEKHVLISTAIVSGMGFADMMAVNTALPVIQIELGMDAASALWVAEVYLLFIASLMMMGGALGDRFGRRRILRYGIYAFAASSLLCALSTSSGMLIAARAVQGVSAAFTGPSSLALLNACFPPDRRGRAVGTWAAISSLMLPLGPLLGGAAVDLLSWHWIFLINIPLCAAAVVVLRGVPRPPFDPPGSARLDIAGIIGMTGSLGTLVFGLLEGARRGFGDDLVVASLAAAAVLLPLTLIVEAKSREPMLPLWMFRRPEFVTANLQTFLFFSGFQGAMFLMPFFYIQVFGFSALQAGAAGLPISAAIIVLSRPVGRLMDRIGAGPPLAVAPFVVAAALYALAQAPANGLFLEDVLPAVIVMSIGLGFFVTPITTVAMNAAGEGRSGLASAVNNTVARVAGLISIAILGVVLSSGFAGHLGPLLGPLDLNADQSAAIAAQVQRLGAITPPEGLTGPQTETFRELVRQAFAGGFHDAITTAAAFMFFAGIVGLMSFRTFKPAGAEK